MTASDVDGVVTNRFYMRAGHIDERADLTAVRFQIYADGNLFPDDPVAGTAEGTFHIADVPTGSYLLGVTSPSGYTSWTQQDTHQVKWTWSYVGRGDVVEAPTPAYPAPTQLRLAGLQPWTGDDDLVINSWEVGYELGVPSLSPALIAGATSIDASFDWNRGYSFGRVDPPLLDPAAGDTVAVSRLSQTRTGDGISVSKLTQIAVAVPRTDGADTVIEGSFRDVVSTRTQRVVLDLDEVSKFFDLTDRRLWSISLLTNPAASIVETMGPPLMMSSNVDVDRAKVSGIVDVTESFASPFEPSWPIVVNTRIENGYIGERRYLYSAELLREGEHVVSLHTAFIHTLVLDGAQVNDEAVIDLSRDAHELVVTYPPDVASYLVQFVGPTRLQVRAEGQVVRLPAGALTAGMYVVYAWAFPGADQDVRSAHATLGTITLR